MSNIHLYNVLISHYQLTSAKITNEMLECSHMTSTNQSQPDAKFVTEQEKEKEEEEEEWLWFKAWI